VTDRSSEVVELSQERILHLLTRGEMHIEGLIPWSSNATMLVTVRKDELSTLAVYKPQRGERPLWDFEYGTLSLREVAAYLLSEAVGWHLVPPTVLRQGPHGTGSVQLFIHAQEDAHYFTVQDDPVYAHVLRRLAAFDVVANNADRKAGHCLLDGEGRLWAIDNALTFHEQPKLRTVIWDFAGEPLSRGIVVDLRALAASLEAGSNVRDVLEQLLSQGEVAALCRRLDHFLQAGCFPEPGPGRHVPWPMV
jgi:hypothetical protein